MSNWKHEIVLPDNWSSHEALEELNPFIDELLEKLTEWTGEEARLNDADGFSRDGIEADDVAAFDNGMSIIYDIADEHRIWISPFGLPGDAA